MVRYAAETRLRYEPGSSNLYSNLGYVVLTKVIEKASGLPYESFIRDSILSPAGCHDMHIGRSSYEQKFPNEVRYYEPSDAEPTEAFDGSGRLVPRSYGGCDMQVLSGAGGWVASPAELMKFITAIDPGDSRPDILKPETIAYMTEKDKSKYPIGWMRTTESDDWSRTGLALGIERAAQTAARRIQLGVHHEHEFVVGLAIHAQDFGDDEAGHEQGQTMARPGPVLRRTAAAFRTAARHGAAGRIPPGRKSRLRIPAQAADRPYSGSPETRLTGTADAYSADCTTARNFGASDPPTIRPTIRPHSQVQPEKEPPDVPRKSILLLFAREIAALDILDITTDARHHLRIKIGVATQETGGELVVDSQHIVNDEHLSVGTSSGSDADRRNFQFLRNTRSEHGRNLLEHQTETAGFLEQMSVADELGRLGLFLGPNGIGPVFVNGWRSQAQMPHEPGNAGRRECAVPTRGSPRLLRA